MRLDRFKAKQDGFRWWAKLCNVHCLVPGGLQGPAEGHVSKRKGTRNDGNCKSAAPGHNITGTMRTIDAAGSIR